MTKYVDWVSLLFMLIYAVSDAIVFHADSFWPGAIKSLIVAAVLTTIIRFVVKKIYQHKR